MVFSKGGRRPACKKLLGLFNQYLIPISLLEMDQVYGGSDIHDQLKGMTQQRTVPNVFIVGHHIGGYDDTLAAL